MSSKKEIPGVTCFKNTRRRFTSLTLSKIMSLGVMFAGGGCSDDDPEDAPKEVAVTVYGESFIEDGIPASEMDDGWAVAFTKFDVSVTDISVPGASLNVSGPTDLAVPSDGAGHPLGTVMATDADLIGTSFSLGQFVVAGVATSPTNETKSFDWTFDVPTRYTACELEGTDRFEITVHGDHLFFNSLVSTEPMVVFQSLANADINNDGIIAQTELTSTGIGGFDSGSAGGIDNLWAWLEAQVGLAGHVNGEGHCDAAPVE